MSLGQNSKQQEASIKVTTETSCQDHPDLDTGKMPSMEHNKNQNFFLFQKYLFYPQS